MCDGSIAFVVAGRRPAAAVSPGQHRLNAKNRLNLGFAVNTQNDSLVQRIRIMADNTD